MVCCHSSALFYILPSPQGNARDVNLVLEVEISDGQDHGQGVPNPRVTVQVVLSDINDRFPMFTNLPATITAPEVSNALYWVFLQHNNSYSNTCIWIIAMWLINLLYNYSFLQDKNINSVLFTAVATDDDAAGNAVVDFYLESVDGVTCYNVTISTPQCVRTLTHHTHHTLHTHQSIRTLTHHTLHTHQCVRTLTQHTQHTLHTHHSVRTLTHHTQTCRVSMYPHTSHTCRRCSM